MTRTKRPLTKRQKEILDFLVSRICRDGIPPTIREIGDEFDINSTNGIVDHLEALRKKGYLRERTGRSRDIHVLKLSDDSEVLRWEPVTGFSMKKWVNGDVRDRDL